MSFSTNKAAGRSSSHSRGQHASASLSQDQQLEIKEAFQLFDMDKDERIDYHELKVAMRALGFDQKKAQVLQILNSNGDGQGYIGEQAFVQVSEYRTRSLVSASGRATELTSAARNASSSSDQDDPGS